MLKYSSTATASWPGIFGYFVIPFAYSFPPNSVIYFYWLLKHDYLLTLFVLGILGHLVCRICFAYYFFFFLNFANLMGLLCGGYYRYLLWYDLDSHTVVNVPAFWSFTEEETDDEDGDKSSKRRKKSQRSKRYRKESSSDDIA